MNKTLYNIGLGLAIALILCLLPMPYGYYIFIRFVSMIVFGCMALAFYKEDKLPFSIIAGSLALLFQPFMKIALGRELWNVVDVIVAIALILLWYNNKKK
jgi:hypothetical protein